MVRLALLFISISAFTLSAQSISGTLLGTVRDSSGAVVAGAKIRVTNEGTGISVETKGNDSGDYVIPNLAAATYTIHVETPGFRSVEIKQIRLLQSQTVRNDVRLEPGTIEQSVNVEAAALVVNSET